MRKAQKNMALEFVRTLNQAHVQIRSMVNKKDSICAMDLLEQCQEGAIQLGGLIENVEGEDFVTVGLLEDYCEIVYKIHKDLNTNEDKNGSNVYKLLHKQIVQVENSIKNDIKQKIEVAFLPYNASMWDSLESVWKAADESEDCDAYVIPIPYYYKNPDGSFKEEHWEGDKYPDYVPITKYEDYDFEEHHPDMIFIHNPYDDCNMVTSVHPYFFSNNLQKYTDNLVYIPYFIWNEVSPDNQVAVEAIQHFCTVPGVINADKVIVQSENLRRIYIDVLVKNAGENTRGYWEDVILGLGSPKTDKVLSSKKEELQIPGGWNNIIQMPDGSRKKVVLYNTGIGALLQHRERMLEKMKDVFENFKENQDGVALLWRPHPLIKATIESMLPQLISRYQEMIKWYREEGWGIYDDSSDMNKAVAVSDAYYGDESSLVQLCRKVRKSVMLQNVTVRDNIDDKWLSLVAEDCVQVDNQLIFIARDINIIYSLDLGTGEIVIIGSIPEENVLTKRLGAKVVHWKEELIFAPMKAKKIWIYNLKKREWHGLERKKIEENKTDLEMFEAVLYENTLFIIGSNYPAIICLDLQTENMTYIEEPYIRLKEKKEGLADCYFRCGYVQKENYLYMASSLENLVLEFNMDTHDFNWIKVGDDKNRYSGIEWDGKNFWLAPRLNTAIVKWDGVNSATEFPLTAEFQEEKNNFLGAICVHDNIVFPGLLSPYEVVISDLEQEDISVVQGQYYFYKKINNVLVVNQDIEGKINIKNLEGIDREFDCCIKKEKIKKYLENKNVDIIDHLATNLERESDIFDVSDFIEQVSKMDNTEEMIKTNNYGRKIWEKLRN
jgi:hypothetical protein